MKKHLWVLAIPVIALAATFQLTFDLGEQGKLDSSFLRENIYPIARTINGIMTNVKFRLRGHEKVQSNIVIVEADDDSVEQIGRWPWKRKIYAYLIHSIFKTGAKYVGIDVTFSEPEESVPNDLKDLMLKKAPELASQLSEWDGDAAFAEVISAYRSQTVLGQATHVNIQPRYAAADALEAMESEDYGKKVPAQISKFALQDSVPFSPEIMRATPMMYLLSVIANIPALREVAQHAGFFYVDPDPDGYVRRYPLFLLNGQQAYTTLAVKLAELSKQDKLRTQYTSDGRVAKVYFEKEPNRPIPVTSLGYIDLNFRGPSRTFQYVSAVDVIRAAEDPNETEIRAILKDAIVIFGVSAIGLYDMRAFPFDSNTPGVEGHATALDNILNYDYMRSATAVQLPWLPLALLIILGILFAIFFSRLDAVPSLLIFGGFGVAAGAIDILLLFKNHINLPSAFLFLEILAIFAIILSVRYYLEEKDKKHIRDAFSHYLAPQVVDMVLKDPSKLTVGGERKDISILFSDLRGFTTISEGMDPKTLSQFLNEYLSEMTDIVFEHQGTLDKYIGDAIMAFWGAPLPQENHAELATRAAVKMIQRLKEIAPDFKSRYNVDVGMGIGINSGVVSVGNMGSKKIFEYTVIGDHVNLASRLEGLNRLYGTDILTSKNTIESMGDALRSEFSFRIIDSVKVKGKKQAIDLFHVSHFQMQPEILQRFNEGKESFRARQWDEAEKRFQSASDLHQKHHGTVDPVAELFIERIREFKINPPEEQWDGTIEMRTK